MRDIDELAVVIHQTARDHGFWDKERNFGEMLMLVTSELAEALEEDRAGKPSVYWKCTGCGGETLEQTDVACRNGLMKPEGALVEIADAIIRLCDIGHAEASMTKFTLGWVIEHKMEYNTQREHMHGKAY